MNDQPAVTVEVVPGVDPPRIRLIGELDLAGAGAVRGCIDAVLAEDPERIDIDMAELAFIDSSGLSVLIAAAAAVPVCLHDTTPAVRRVFEVTGLEDMWELMP